MKPLWIFCVKRRQSAPTVRIAIKKAWFYKNIDDKKSGVVVSIKLRNSDFAAKMQTLFSLVESVTAIAPKPTIDDLKACHLTTIIPLAINLWSRLVKQEKIDIGITALLMPSRWLVISIPGNRVCCVRIGFNKTVSAEVAGWMLPCRRSAMSPVAIDKDDVEKTIDRELDIARETTRARRQIGRHGWKNCTKANSINSIKSQPCLTRNTLLITKWRYVSFKALRKTLRLAPWNDSPWHNHFKIPVFRDFLNKLIDKLCHWRNQ